jgi:UDP-N-acetylmuramoylalanine--D-glutamate ligase
MDYKGKKVMVVGMAKSGLASARLLLDVGAKVVLYDMKTKDQFPEGTFNEFEGRAELALGADPDAVAKNCDALVLSPGVPMNLSFILHAQQIGKPVIGEIELGFLYSPADFVAITGTNGKTTTTALTGEIFKNAGFCTHVLGNIGIPIAGEALKTKDGDVVVAETAALQLDTIDTFRPHACTVLNVTEDHLNRYGTMENYTAAKELIFKNQTEYDFCVLNYDNAITRAMEGKQKSKIIWFSRQVRLDRGVSIDEGRIISAEDDGIHEIGLPEEIKIPGAHNLENSLAAIALARCYGIPESVIRDTLMTFPGVEHRIEFVRELDGIRYINDSKGTNPDATEKAAAAMTRPTVLILGGYDKQSSFVSLLEGFGPLIKHVVAIGATQAKILSDAKTAGFESLCTADGFEEAVIKARGLAKAGWNVLLSPACASYDMFSDFEQRGRVFKSIVNSF